MKKTLAIVILSTLLFAGCKEKNTEPLFVQPDQMPSPTLSPQPTSLPATASASPTDKPGTKPSPSPKVQASASPLTIIQLPSTNKSDNERDLQSIDTIIVHTLYNPNAHGDLSITTAKEVLDDAAVSSHYVIARDGKVYQLVPEKYQAWHAGESKMPGADGRTGVNVFSLGIELIATETSGITAAQYNSLTSLVLDISIRLPIKNILGHADIAPGRKTDPWKFDWKTWQASLQAKSSKSFTFFH